MRCNPSYWLLGLVPIAMLSWIAVQLQHEDIENDLARRTAEALKRAGLAWATPHVSGRDVVLTGKAPEERGPVLRDGLCAQHLGRPGRAQPIGTHRTASPTIAGRRRRRGLDVFGSRETFRPSGREDRSSTQPKPRFPPAAVADNMRLARGSIDRDAWLRWCQIQPENTVCS